jgi:hypothetical protein
MEGLLAEGKRMIVDWMTIGWTSSEGGTNTKGRRTGEKKVK